MDWTIGPLDYFFAPFFGPFYREEADRLYLGEGWDAI